MMQGLDEQVNNLWSGGVNWGFKPCQHDDLEMEEEMEEVI